MLEVEWHRGQGMRRDSALDKVSKAHKLSFSTMRKAYEKKKYSTKRRAQDAFELAMNIKPQTDRDLRELFRDYPGELKLLMKCEMERLQGEMEDLRRRGRMDKRPRHIEVLRGQIEVLRWLESL